MTTTNNTAAAATCTVLPVDYFATRRAMLTMRAQPATCACCQQPLSGDVRPVDGICADCLWEDIDRPVSAQFNPPAWAESLAESELARLTADDYLGTAPRQRQNARIEGESAKSAMMTDRAVIARREAQLESEKAAYGCVEALARFFQDPANDGKTPKLVVTDGRATYVVDTADRDDAYETRTLRQLLREFGKRL